VGELGWEFYIPSGFATAVFDATMAAGSAFDLPLVGMQAVNSLRVEAGLRHWESDIGPEDSSQSASAITL
jgi:glycine cleavage system aminomethyltransferase T